MIEYTLIGTYFERFTEYIQSVFTCTCKFVTMDMHI